MSIIDILVYIIFLPITISEWIINSIGSIIWYIFTSPYLLFIFIGIVLSIIIGTVGFEFAFFLFVCLIPLLWPIIWPILAMIGTVFVEIFITLLSIKLW